MSRRAADAFERALADPAQAPGPRTRELVAVAGDLGATGARVTQRVAPDATFRDELRRRLVAEAAELSAERAARGVALVGSAVPGRSGTAGPSGGTRVLVVGRARRITAATLVTVLAGGTAAAVASSSALPGDTLYPVKRGIEQVRLATALSDAARGSTDLSLARERVDEAEALTRAAGADRSPGRLDPRTTERVSAALDEFDQRARSGTATLVEEYADSGDASRLAQVDTFLREVLPRLERLREQLPPSLQPLVDDLLADLGEVARDVAATATACGSSCTNLGVGKAAEVADGLLLAAPVPQAPEPQPAAADDSPAPAPGSGTPPSGAAGPAAPGPDAAAPGAPAPAQTAAPAVPPAGRLELGGGSAVVALPGVTASVGVPTVGVDRSGATVGVPLPGLTLGGSTITLPSVGITVPLTPPTAPPAPGQDAPPCVVLIVALCVEP